MKTDALTPEQVQEWLKRPNHAMNNMAIGEFTDLCRMALRSATQTEGVAEAIRIGQAACKEYADWYDHGKADDGDSMAYYLRNDINYMLDALSPTAASAAPDNAAAQEKAKMEEPHWNIHDD